MKEIIKNKLLESDNLVDLLSTALYGNEWFSATYYPQFNNLISPQSECREDKLADVLKGGGFIVITDWEDDESEHEVTLDRIVDAICKMAIEQPKVYGRLITFDGEADFYDADCVLQYAVYDEWVYG